MDMQGQVIDFKVYPSCITVGKLWQLSEMSGHIVLQCLVLKAANCESSGPYAINSIHIIVSKEMWEMFQNMNFHFNSHPGCPTESLLNSVTLNKQVSAIPNEGRDNPQKFSIDNKCNLHFQTPSPERLWTLLTMFSRHQGTGRPGRWEVYWQTAPCTRLDSAVRSDTPVRWHGSRAPRMAGRRRGRGNNVQQQQHAPQNQRQGPRGVSPLLSIWNVATLFTLTLQIRIMWESTVLENTFWLSGFCTLFKKSCKENVKCKSNLLLRQALNITEGNISSVTIWAGSGEITD